MGAVARLCLSGSQNPSTVIPGLDPGIQALGSGVDGRDKTVRSPPVIASEAKQSS
ncbi:hypothetical protein GCM10007036_32030 [Alsobacter metallidurans]|uniref:Uncharacterized protein n=1 Tax=Alsobacter metallidurans TaxID=340221 RepID=A0A917I8C2_9HYPH|nr:hypothetical protein GCM10007036_32030 [Alsobacter metallidurans]